jgi:beta-lactamase superfamily II metal-dependent hydrolase
MKKISSKLVSVMLTFCILSGAFLPGNPDRVFGAVNAKPSMRIHAIYQGHPKIKEDDDTKYVAGDAVLIESDDEFLLMDTGSSNDESVKKTVAYLKKMVGTGDSQKPLSIYISHYHGDHTGGILAVSNAFRISAYYLPDPVLYRHDMKSIKDNAPEVLTGLRDQYNKCVKRAEQEQKSNAKSAAREKKGITDGQRLNAIDKKWKTETIKLKGGSSIRAGGNGDVKLTVLAETGGPKDTYKSVGFVNNKSLATMVTCGNIRFLTAGDLEKGGEWTLKNGKSKLNAHIFKLDHHGIRGASDVNRRSNHKEMFAKIQPKISFVQSKGDRKQWEREENARGKPTGSKKYMRPYNSMAFARKYGLCFSTTHEERNFIIDVADNKIRLYRTGVPIKNLRDEYRMVGIKKIVLYRHEKDGEKVENGWYYIDPSLGYRTKAGLVKARFEGKLYRYYVKTTGAVLRSGSIKIGAKTYYFDGKGRELTGKGGKVKVYS